jgi:antirestriction protein ArdC
MATTKTSKVKAKTPRVSKGRRDVHAETSAKVIAALKEGKIPWQWDKPWKSTDSYAPRSLASNKLYRGVNQLLLMFAAQDGGYESGRWGTYNQMADLAGMVKIEEGTGKFKRVRYVSPVLEDGTVDPTPRGVRKGEKSTEIVWTNIWKKEEYDETLKKMVTRKIPLLKFFHVFAMEQCEFPEGTRGAKLLAAATAKPEVTPAERDEAAEALVADYLAKGPSLAHGGNSAHYVPATDHIQMPRLESFTSTAHYMSTLYHEVTHSTGHDSRLKRTGIADGTFGPFGSEVYSQEELVAEMGATMLCATAGIEQSAVFNNSLAYIQHWISKLEEDDKLLMRAASQAQRAVDLVLGITFKEDDKEEGVES